MADVLDQHAITVHIEQNPPVADTKTKFRAKIRQSLHVTRQIIVKALDFAIDQGGYDFFL
jgi:hypothetical protein